MREEEEEMGILLHKKANIQKYGKGLEDLLVGARTKEDWQLERLEDVESLTNIIHRYRVRGARSQEIAWAIIEFVKEGD